MVFCAFLCLIIFKNEDFYLFNKDIMDLWVGKLLKMKTNYLF